MSNPWIEFQKANKGKYTKEEMSLAYQQAKTLQSSTVVIKSPKNSKKSVRKSSRSPKKQEEIYPLNELPNDVVIYNLINHMGFEEFSQFCQTNTYYRQICQDDVLWKNIFNKYYSQCCKDIKPNISYYNKIKDCHLLKEKFKNKLLVFNPETKKFIYAGSKQNMNLVDKYGDCFISYGDV